MFDYSYLPEQARLDVLSATAEIRDHAVGAMRSAIEIGRCLLKVKAILPHGDFGPWLARRLPVQRRRADGAQVRRRSAGRHASERHADVRGP